MILLNLILGTLVTTVGFSILWGTASPIVIGGWAIVLGGFLWWKVRSITELWAWTTLLLGLESFAWPIQQMIQVKGAAETPSADEMGTILSAVILGLFSSVFWISFSYGLFKRAWGASADADHAATPAQAAGSQAKRKTHR